MPLGAPVEAPWGYVSLCARSPVDCVLYDTPQARAGAVLAARALMKARWEQAIQLAAERGMLPRSAVPASLGDAGIAPAAPVETKEASEPWRIELKTAWRTVERINKRVNRTIRPASDLDVHGVRDWWVAPLSSGQAPYGDCKDYVLEKRRELIAAGVPARTLTIALVRTAWGESHAVLVIAARDGDYVLDSLASKIRPWSQVPYVWVARQSPEDPMVWRSVLTGSSS